ncbi:MAG TPA: DNA/RNA helicase domain-containing protein [Rhodopila sp.]|nr:DNA/RNA helicase domain-containing protein [Rhodopila sp.]
MRNQRRGYERAGLLASSNAARLKPHGIFVKLKIEPEKWFLAPADDVRSSDALEDAATEFDVQGLELDWACLCWDANLRRGSGWQTWRFRGTRWESINDPARRAYLLNSYRVLLTRARQGLVVFVPHGSQDDRTRPPELYDDVYDFLITCGFDPL